MAIYHSGFYAPLHLFGEGKLVRTTELTKLAIRATSFNAQCILGFPTPYPEDEDSISSIMQQGLIKSADFEDFFYYADRNALTKYNDLPPINRWVVSLHKRFCEQL